MPGRRGRCTSPCEATPGCRPRRASWSTTSWASPRPAPEVLQPSRIAKGAVDRIPIPLLHRRMVRWPHRLSPRAMELPMSRDSAASDIEIQRIRKDWSENPRWTGVKRGYTAEDVYRLRGSVQVEHTLARRGAEKLWKLMHERPFVNSLGAMTGNQAMQQVRAGV